jgi:hypothetical protein
MQRRFVTKLRLTIGVALLAMLALLSGRGSYAEPPTLEQTEQAEFFEKRVRPILAERCFKCHSAQSAQSNLRLDSRAGLLSGGARGPGAVPGQPDKSLLVTAISYADAKLQMPPQGKLKADEVAVLTDWVARGAFWPVDKAPAAAPKSGFDLQARARHWSFQPLHRPAMPAVHNVAWTHNPIDRFILAKLEAQGISPAPAADRRTLIRRVTYDLIGLPPTPEEVAAFVNDKSPNAWEKVVDRLLASPHYGERWARHWMDLVRYAETDGHEFDFEKPGAYQYRDYLIRAFNADLPYDQFVREHIAGDLLPHPRLDPAGLSAGRGGNESILATAFYFLGEGTHSPVDLREDEAGRIDNQIDVISKTFLGLSVGCARCHDHKFDPISTKDYYALSGYLKSSRYAVLDLTAPGRDHPALVGLEQANAQLETLASNSTPHEKPFRLLSGQTLYAGFTGATWQECGGWTAAGAAFGQGPRRAALLIREETGKEPFLQTLGGPGVVDSGYLSGRLHGALRSPTFTLTKPFIFYHLAGQDVAVRLIIDGFQRIQAPIYGGLQFSPEAPDRMRWQGQDVRKWLGHRAYIEFVDRSDGRLICDGVVFSEGDAPPADLQPEGGPRVASLPAGDRTGAPAPVAVPADLLAHRRALEAALPSPRWAIAIADGTGENDRVHIRGNVATLGAEAPRRFLEVCSGAIQPAPAAGSGRLELAERMVAASDPLLPRVMVNRIWQHHFGEGIVRSPDDFGLMGQPPTHPELLDWLATEFVRQGWSIKKMHRLMLLSAAYRMSSLGDARAERLDPTDRLLHRMPVRRLEAEAIRDAVLAVSGRLNPTLYGPSVMPYLTSFMQGRGRPEQSGPLDGDGRRSLYISVRRNFLTPFFTAFDYPTPFTTIGRRTVSNVPAQALAMMNNPFIVEQAGVWAQRMLAAPGLTPEQRIARMYETAFSRPPTSAETAKLLAFLHEQDRFYGAANSPESRQDRSAERPNTRTPEHPNTQRPTPNAAIDPRSWQDLCHVLYNLKEFIYID